MPDGSRVAILVLSDHAAATDAPPERVSQLSALISWMEQDLLRTLEQAGYAPRSIDDPATQPGPGSYVLETKLRRYDPGNAALRTPGPGTAVLDTQFELRGGAGDVVVRGEPSIGDARDWKKAAHEANLQTVDAVTGRLVQR